MQYENAEYEKKHVKEPKSSNVTTSTKLGVNLTNGLSHIEKPPDDIQVNISLTSVVYLYVEIYSSLWYFHIEDLVESKRIELLFKTSIYVDDVDISNRVCVSVILDLG